MATSAATFAQIVLLVYMYVMPEINGEISTVEGELRTNVDLPCSCALPFDSIFSVQWFKSRYHDRFVKDGKALVWWSKSVENSYLPGFSLKEESSVMTVSNANLTNEGLFRCYVTHELADGNPDECIGEVKLSIYANPDRLPVISHKRHPNGLNVTCSVDNVFPMKYPNIISTTTGMNERQYIQNADGTFNTAVTCMFPLNYTTIQCKYSSVRVKMVSSLEIAKLDINELDEKSDELAMVDMTNMTVGHQPLSCRKMIGAILGMEVICLIILIIKIITGCCRQKDERSTTTSKGKNKCHKCLRKLRSFCFSDYFFKMVTFVIILICIITFVYYLTEDCFIFKVKSTPDE